MGLDFLFFILYFFLTQYVPKHFPPVFGTWLHTAVSCLVQYYYDSGLTCRQLGFHLTHIHSGTAQLLACTLSLGLLLSKTMKMQMEM